MQQLGCQFYSLCKKKLHLKIQLSRDSYIQQMKSRHVKNLSVFHTDKLYPDYFSSVKIQELNSRYYYAKCSMI